MPDVELAPDDDVELVTATYDPDQGRTLSDAVLEAVEKFKGTDLTRSDFTLFDNIDPDGLDALFRHDAEPETLVQFAVADVYVTVWGDGGVEIRVTDHPWEPL